MSSQQDDTKLFILEIDPATGKGIYRLNPIALPRIRADLQLFQDYVAPFTVTGDPRTATITDKDYGTIHREDRFWIVDKKLKIVIK